MITLLPFHIQDAPQLLQWITSPKLLMQWAGSNFTWPLTVEQIAQYHAGTQGERPLRLIYTVIDTETDTAVGHICLNNIHYDNQSATVSRVFVDDSQRGRGVCRQMMGELLRIGFDELNLHRIDLVVFDYNTPAIRSYERAGFTQEGVLRDSRKLGDQFYSLIQMSILAPEYRAKQTHS